MGRQTGLNDTAPNSFEHLDRDAFRRQYTDEARGNRMSFVLEGVHCTSCLLRIEGVANEFDHVESIRLDMGRRVAEVDVVEGGTFAPVAARLDEMGYSPQPVSSAELKKNAGSGERKDLLIRIGVAGAAAGNIMLLSTSLYSGAHASRWAPLFEWLTFVLFVPILIYSAVPFYKNSLRALKSRRASIDIPIVGAIVLGTVLGVVHLIAGRGDVYFDSLAVLVFLLLCARLLLLGLQQKFLSPDRLRAFFETKSVRVKTAAGDLEERHVDQVAAGDEVVIFRGERIPVDGQLLTEQAFVNAAVLTGESFPRRVLKGQKVFAGTELSSEQAHVGVEHVGAETRVGALLAEAEKGALGRSPLVSFTDRAAQWFAISVLAIGVVFAVVYSFVNVEEALNRSLALIILACPCALALATPLTQSLALRKAAKSGVLIRKAEAFERLYQVQNVFLDKTGTITRGELVLESWSPEAPDREEWSVIRSLEAASVHPIGHVLVNTAEAERAPFAPVTERQETHGVGVSGSLRGVVYEMRSLRSREELSALGLSPSAARTDVGLYRDGVLQRVAHFSDHVRDSSAAAVGRMRDRGLAVFLLTGDAQGPAHSVAEAVGIKRDHVMSAQSPEEKRDVLAARPRSLMAGDGVNDAVALTGAHVGVAVHGSMETSFKAADVYLTQPGLDPLADLFDLSSDTISIVRRNLVFSLLYNATGATLALLGVINPLVAAILMPASSITVVLMSVIGTRRWRQFEKPIAERTRPGQSALGALVPKEGV